MLSFSVIIFYSAIEIGPYSLYRKNVISAFKLYKKIVRSRYSFPRKNNNDLSLTSQEPRFCICCVCARTRERALMTRKSCAVGMRNAILTNHLKDLRSKIFQSIDFLKFLRQSDNEFLVSKMQKKLGVTDFVSEIKRVENYPDFEKLAHVIQHGLQGFIVKNIEGESTEANDLSNIL